MTILSITDQQAIDLAIREIHQRPILVQLPTVFGLLAAPTSQGAAQLDQLKSRLPGKTYGTLIGSLDAFVAHTEPALPPYSFSCARHYTSLVGTFIRLPFRDSMVNTPTISQGTHQGLLLTGVYATLSQQIEASFAHYPPDILWAYANYMAPLCTSCNLSGDPNGSIVAYGKALNFARKQGVRLFLTATTATTQTGSYPILGFQKDRVTVHRTGHLSAYDHHFWRLARRL